MVQVWHESQDRVLFYWDPPPRVLWYRLWLLPPSQMCSQLTWSTW